MSYASERADIEARFQALWVTGSPSAPRTPVQYDRHPLAPAPATWVSLTIVSGQAVNASVGSPGSNLVRHAGVVAIKVHTPGGQGSAAARQLLDHAADIFRNWNSGGLLFGVPYPGDPIEEVGSFSVTLFCPFTRDELNG